MEFSPSELFEMVSATKFKPFDKNDWMAFSGCESETPKIGEYGEYILIIDGDILSVIHAEEGDELHFTLDKCF